MREPKAQYSCCRLGDGLSTPKKKRDRAGAGDSATQGTSSDNSVIANPHHNDTRFKASFENVQHAIFTKDLQGKYTEVNASMAQLFKRSAKELIGLTDTELFDEDASEHIRDTDRRVLAGETIEEEHAKFINGVEHVFHVVKVPLRDLANEIIGLCGIASDITDRRMAERALLESERQYRSLFHNSLDAVYISSPAGKLLDINPAGVRLFGYPSKEELLEVDIGRDIFSNPEDRRSLVKTLGKRGYVKDVELRLKDGNGNEFIAIATSTAIRDETGKIISIQGILRDVTEQRKLGEQLWHARKLEAVGTLASGVAHDFNNLLTAILGCAENAKRTLPPEHPAIKSLEMVEQAAHQAGGVTKSLLTFSRKAITVKMPADFALIARDSIRFLRRLLPASVEVIATLPPPGEVWVHADITQLQQILMNLAVNARDAMPSGGRLRIGLSVEPASPSPKTKAGRDQRNVRASNPNAVLVVEDDGPGMPEDVLSRAFEPFFTTKPRTEGTGLGLSVIHGIVANHDGRIDVLSQPGEGTRVMVTLPCCEPPDQTNAPAEKSGNSHPAGHSEIVIVAEDNEQVRAIMTSALRKDGYDVIQTADGVETLEALEKHRDKVGVVVLDLDLPKMHGLDCLHYIRHAGIGVPVIVATGDTSIDVEAHVDHCDRILRKPFRMSDLTTLVTQALAESPQTAEAIK